MSSGLVNHAATPRVEGSGPSIDSGNDHHGDVEAMRTRAHARPLRGQACARVRQRRDLGQATTSEAEYRQLLGQAIVELARESQALTLRGAHRDVVRRAPQNVQQQQPVGDDAQAIPGGDVLGRQDGKEERVHLAEEDEDKYRGEGSDVWVAQAPPLSRVPDGADEQRDGQDNVRYHERWLLAGQHVGDGLTLRQSGTARGTQRNGSSIGRRYGSRTP